MCWLFSLSKAVKLNICGREIMGEAHCKKKISLGLLVNVLLFKLCFVDQSIVKYIFKGDIFWKTLLSLIY